jgi:hypothetical protein
MLTDFLLKFLAEPEALTRSDEDTFYHGLSNEEREVVKDGDIHEIRKLLYREARTLSDNPESRSYLASDFTVSTSCDTPHCPVNPPSTNEPSEPTREPESLWASEGLTIVGTGIRAGLQTTPESLAAIKRASKVLYLVADVLAQRWIKTLNADAESLQRFYRKDTHRINIYNDIVDYILEELKRNSNVCVVFYGHPGCFVYPSHEAIRRARAEGFRARMFPGVSAAENLYADIGVDPGIMGIQSYEATNFVLCGYAFDTSVGLILWQIGLFGFANWDPTYPSAHERLELFVEYMSQFYDGQHEVLLYEASESPLGNPRVTKTTLRNLPNCSVSGVATLYVPPKGQPTVDRSIARRMGIRVFEDRQRPLVEATT